MIVGYATNAEQTQAIERNWPGKIHKFVDDLKNVPSESTVIVNSLRDFNVGVVKLHELSGKYTIYACEPQPKDALEFFAEIERGARRHRSRKAAERRRQEGKRLGPKLVVEKLPKRQYTDLTKAVMDPDKTVAAICKEFKIDRRALINGFEMELKGMGKI